MFRYCQNIKNGKLLLQVMDRSLQTDPKKKVTFTKETIEWADHRDVIPPTLLQWSVPFPLEEHKAKLRALSRKFQYTRNSQCSVLGTFPANSIQIWKKTMRMMSILLKATPNLEL